MKIYYINADCGDGSTSTHFYDSKECIDFCCDEENGFVEEYWSGNGGSWGSFEIPDGTPITGIRIRSMNDLIEKDDPDFYFDL